MHNQMQALRISLLVHSPWDNNNNNNNNIPFKLKEKEFKMEIAIMAKLKMTISALVTKEKTMILRRVFRMQKILRDMCSNTSQRS